MFIFVIEGNEGNEGNKYDKTNLLPFQRGNRSSASLNI